MNKEPRSRISSTYQIFVVTIFLFALFVNLWQHWFLLTSSDELVGGSSFRDDAVLVLDEVTTITTSNNTSSTSKSTSRSEEEELKPQPKVEKLIQPGNHTNILGPNSRNGPDGSYGYIHDPKFLSKNPKPFEILDNEKHRLCLPPGQGDELPEGAEILGKIRRHIEMSNQKIDIKIFCAVYTYKGHLMYTEAIRETWGKRCDGLLFASDNTNITTGHMHLPSNSSYGFGYQGMTQRTRTILAYLYDHFLNDYDYFHIGGDDMFLIVENLKEFLASDKVQQWDRVADQYMIAGFRMLLKFGRKKLSFFGGGSGYTISRKALKAFVEGPLQYCDTEIERPNEDIWFSNCANLLSTKLIDSRDSSGAHRYHQMSVQIHSTFPEKNISLSKADSFLLQSVDQSLQTMEREFSYPLVYMDKYISNSSIVFHRHNPQQLRRYELLLYKNQSDLCGY